jgi:integrase
MPSLTDAAVRALQPSSRPYKQGDAAGLYLLVQPTGSRLWRLNYTLRGKQKTAALGAYPVVSLAAARQARDLVKAQLRAGEDPAEVVKTEAAAAAAAGITFRVVAEDWFRVKMVKEGKAKRTLERTEWLLGILYAGIGNRPVGEIEAPDLLAVLRRIEAAGNHETVKRLRATASLIFRFGIGSGYCKRDPAADLVGILTAVKSRPRSAIVEPAEVGKLMRDIAGYKRPRERLALQLLALTFVRPCELTAAEWSEIGADGVWSIPAERTKMRKDFHVPLSKQALAILKELRSMAGDSKFILPSRRPGRPMTPWLLNRGLRALGYTADQISAHGFRSTASSILNAESKFSPDAIELCLAHKIPGVRGIYNRALRWPERVEIMKWWGNRIDELRHRGEVVEMPKKKKKRKAG